MYVIKGVLNLAKKFLIKVDPKCFFAKCFCECSVPFTRKKIILGFTYLHRQATLRKNLNVISTMDLVKSLVKNGILEFHK